jgi:hypothetical protein
VTDSIGQIICTAYCINYTAYCITLEAVRMSIILVKDKDKASKLSSKYVLMIVKVLQV